jgi:hypothetical protein
MWDRALFRIRAIGPEIGPLLGSWKLSVVLMVASGLYYAFLAIWATSSPPHVVQNIAGLLPFWLVYGLLLLNTFVCLWRRIPGLRRDLGPGPAYGKTPPAWSCGWPADPSEQGAALALERQGYRVSPEGTGRLRGVRRRWAALGTYLFHGAFFLVALGFLLTAMTRYEARVWTAVGEEFTGEGDQYRSQSPPGPLSLGPPDLRFGVVEIAPEFWGDQLLFTRLEAKVTLARNGAAVTRINRPLWVGPATFLRLSGLGYAPRYEIADAGGRVVDSAFAKMDLFPPGQRDFFVPEGLPFRVYLEIYPDLEPGHGVPATATLNLRNPGFVVHVYRGHLDLGRALLKPGETMTFEGYALRFPEVRYWGEFTVVRDAGAPVLLLGYLVGFAGLLLKVRGPRGEVLWEAGADGTPARLSGWGGAAEPEKREVTP